MRCPQCGAKNPLGSQSCASCGRPFTRAAAGHQPVHAATTPARPDVHVHYQADDYAYADYDPYVAARPYRSAAPPRRRLSGCLMALLVLIAISIGVIIALLIATNVFVKPMVADAISSNVGTRIETTVVEQLNVELGDLPSGTITISEADINQRISQSGSLGPIDDVSVGISPGGVEAGIQAYGLSGTYSADVHVHDGRIVLSNSDVSGPLQYVVSDGDIERITTDAINRSLAESGYRVEGVTLHDGELVLSLAR